MFFYPIAHLSTTQHMLEYFYRSPLRLDIVRPANNWSTEEWLRYRTFALQRSKIFVTELHTNVRVTFQTTPIQLYIHQLVPHFHYAMSTGTTMHEFFAQLESKCQRYNPTASRVEILRCMSIVRYGCYQQIGEVVTPNQKKDIDDWTQERSIRYTIQKFVNAFDNSASFDDYMNSLKKSSIKQFLYTGRDGWTDFMQLTYRQFVTKLFCDAITRSIHFHRFGVRQQPNAIQCTNHIRSWQEPFTEPVPIPVTSPKRPSTTTTTSTPSTLSKLDILADIALGKKRLAVDPDSVSPNCKRHTTIQLV